MKFYYTIKPELEEEVILNLPSPYVLEDFARSLLQQFVGGQPKVQALPDGVYLVNLYREANPVDEEIGAINSFIKKNTIIKFLEKPYGQD